ncbi:casein kinase ii beta chain [Phaffia rhodozyma]|uniref:Casein kinase II subunit beta n=1 Tax=Phaffia rhodozyma TaxID=264483 RepID=A0A0F7SF38_PHARH|nr:casein kinase ii beta chain [Phaffia rhodozyma]
MDDYDRQAEQDFLETYASSSQASSGQTSTLTWITWFCSLPGHEYFCEVAEDFIEDDFNLTGLQSMVPFWKEALEMVLDVEPEEDSLKIPDVSIIESSAELLYGLVHQRYILTRQGLQSMSIKTFGACPRVHCHATAVVPCGRSDQPGLDTVKLYCPNCGDIYSPPSSRFQGVDGAFFGTTFPHLFYQTYRDLFPTPFYPHPAQPSLVSSTNPNAPASPSSHRLTEQSRNPDPYGGQKPAFGEVYQKRIYGFRVSERARSGPRMAWLRERPRTWEELAKVDWRGRWIGGDGKDGDDDEDGKGKPTGEKGDLFEGEDEEEPEEESEEEEEEEGGAGVASKNAAAPIKNALALPLAALPLQGALPSPPVSTIISRPKRSVPRTFPCEASYHPRFTDSAISASETEGTAGDSDSDDALDTPNEAAPRFFTASRKAAVAGRMTQGMEKTQSVETEVTVLEIF